MPFFSDVNTNNLKTQRVHYEVIVLANHLIEYLLYVKINVMH